MRRSAAWSMPRWCRTRPSRICSSGRLTWSATSPPSLPWTPVMSSPPEPWAGSATPEPRLATCRTARRWWQGSKASARRSTWLDVQLAVTAGDDRSRSHGPIEASRLDDRGPPVFPGQAGAGQRRRAVRAERAARLDGPARLVPRRPQCPRRRPPRALGCDRDRLRSFVEVEQDALIAAFEKLDVERWATEVVTAQGRHVSAASLPWLRTREVWVHAADLHGAADFPDFPPPLLDELIADVLRFRRDAREEALQVRPTDRIGRAHV